MKKEKPFVPGEDWVWYARAIYGEEEIEAVVESLESDWLAPGKYSKEFEEKVAAVYGQKYGLFVNSGSSANMLAIETLGLPRGGEVITPACTFSAVVNPLLFSGLIPVLIDVELDTYNIDISKIESAITDKTVALMIPHLVGNLNDMEKLHTIAKKYDLKLIEDSCDTIGALIDGKPTSEHADATTTSFYASHIITASGGGGMVMFKDKALVDDAKVRRDWGRALPEHIDESPDKRFTFSLNNTPHDGKFIFNRIGHNLKPVESQAAFGLVQLKRLPTFAETRKKNFKTLYEFCSKYPEHFILPRELPNSSTNWLAFPITIAKGSTIKRVDLMQYLEDHKIQTRVLFAGNISLHPAYKDTHFKIPASLDNSDYILGNSMLIGCHHGLTEAHMKYQMDTIKNFIENLA